ncbi:hypothetical protein EB796_020440 [Bugula neritina]|uniref:Uncharacterized protein n=1 Tax=Bugula neritina TaxID=10212 RepID=A0A7J7J6I2_BUGNE|nr:hypothetical protein EB796_020440 [Bugula neritina]
MSLGLHCMLTHPEVLISYITTDFVCIIELQDIFVVDDDDEQMTEDMWREFERFEAERNDELLQYHQQHEQ